MEEVKNSSHLFATVEVGGKYAIDNEYKHKRVNHSKEGWTRGEVYANGIVFSWQPVLSKP
jgi:hypothetical protein